VLAIAFHVRDGRYAIACRDVLEVVPAVDLRVLEQAPAWVAGVFTWRGDTIAVIDLVRRMTGVPCAATMSSRIAVVPFEGRALGLLVERLTGTVDLDPAAGLAGLALPDAPYLGELVASDGALIQLVRVGELVPPETRDLLFGRAGADA
jgi:chemotaxis-related protein WspB